MRESPFYRFARAPGRLGAEGGDAPEFCLGREGPYELRYIPFEHVNPKARLVIVGITPGPTQIGLAYATAYSLLAGGADRDMALLVAASASSACLPVSSRSMNSAVFDACSSLISSSSHVGEPAKSPQYDFIPPERGH